MNEMFIKYSGDPWMDIHEIWRGHSANVTTFCFLSFHGQKIKQKLEKHKNIAMRNVLIQNINCVLNEMFL